MAKPLTSVVLSKKKRKVFLSILAQTGQVAAASRASGYQNTSFLTKLRREDEDFADEWDLALESAKHVLEEEIVRRARDGVMEPVFYKGEIVGHKVNYSDALAMFILRKLDPSYRDTGRNHEMNINFGIAVLPMTATSDEAWEQRALEMHGGQKTITLEAKPVENNMARITRGD